MGRSPVSLFIAPSEQHALDQVALLQPRLQPHRELEPAQQQQQPQRRTSDFA